MTRSQLLWKNGLTTGTGLSFIEIPLDAKMTIKHVSLGIDSDSAPQLVNIVIINKVMNHGLGVIRGLGSRIDGNSLFGVHRPIDFPVPEQGNWVIRGRVYDFGKVAINYSLKVMVKYND